MLLRAYPNIYYRTFIFCLQGAFAPVNMFLLRLCRAKYTEREGDWFHGEDEEGNWDELCKERSIPVISKNDL